MPLSWADGHCDGARCGTTGHREQARSPVARPERVRYREPIAHLPSHGDACATAHACSDAEAGASRKYLGVDAVQWVGREHIV